MSDPKTKMQEPNWQNSHYELAVAALPDGRLSIVIDGAESVADGFEFSAPRGQGGLKVRQVMRIELGEGR